MVDMLETLGPAAWNRVNSEALAAPEPRHG